jgi:hypothetical protein
MKKDTGIKTTKRTLIRETDLGVYVWERPNGKILADENNNPLNIPSEYGDLRKMAELQRAAHYWLGVMDLPKEGKPIFWDVHRCTEEEYQEQVEAMDNGILPDTNIRRRR